jgi:Lon-like protease
MSRRVVTMITGALLLLGLGIGAAQLPVPYAELRPGPTLDTLGRDQNGKEIIQVTGRSERTSSGHLNLTTVTVRDGLDLLTAFRGWLDRDRSVVPREEIFPPGKTEQQVQRENTEAFTTSQSSAEFAALGELGYPAEVVVRSIPSGSPSTGKLRAGDVVQSVNGRPVKTYDDVSGVLTAVDPGATVTVGYLRAGKPGTARIRTIKAKDRKGAAIGVLLSLERKAPFDVRIGLSEDIGGPSAGLMFALGIIEKVGPDDLTGGKFIAGTGAIEMDGKVDPIGGIPLKMIAARGQGATVFLVPADNCAEAVRDPPKGLQLVKVENLHAAVAALKSIKAGQPAPACPTS